MTGLAEVSVLVSWTSCSRHRPTPKLFLQMLWTASQEILRLRSTGGAKHQGVEDDEVELDRRHGEPSVLFMKVHESVPDVHPCKVAPLPRR